MAQLEGKKLCKKCNARPVYVQNGRVHDFCGIRCANAFRSGTPVPMSPRASPAPSGNSICRLPGCRRRVWTGRDGIPSQFCSNRHRRDAVRTGNAEGCLLCNQLPKAVVNGKLTDFCSKTCSLDAINAAPIILQVNRSHAEFYSVKRQFSEGWKHGTNVPAVVHVWKIYGEKGIYDKFARYKLGVERRTSLKGGNTCRRWHGTVRACQLGNDDGMHELCRNPACSLCEIIRSSFQLTRVGQRTNFGRFGAGIYTSATSSKANDYVAEWGDSPYRAMLLSKVVMGKAIKLQMGDQRLTKPPQGYDSVVGEPGGDLNYDESIVYKNEAIRPLFLVVYRP
ncbi:hypothetical protein SCP_1104100 [Sparassis crispa]|uniref:PARP catalytic domain-containing protein n=1 Tax=Sparassis crispa TaxID=139825 RepID=A0A401GZY8_9APHY|nr:hypothetical protein SCP_1104100 [Sparassis crispa]GBE87733.1 hypothetical protein SCP_1104100 [Sparassis crispa]